MIRRILLVSIIKEENKYLLTKQSSTGRQSEFWGFPGGNLEVSDTDIENALEREVKEEVGLRVVESKLIGTHVSYIKKEDIQLLFLYFLSNVENSKLTLGKEIDEYKWMSFDDLLIFPRKMIRPPVGWYEKVIQILDGMEIDKTI